MHQKFNLFYFDFYNFSLSVKKNIHIQQQHIKWENYCTLQPSTHNMYWSSLYSKKIWHKIPSTWSEWPCPLYLSSTHDMTRLCCALHSSLYNKLEGLDTWGTFHTTCSSPCSFDSSSSPCTPPCSLSSQGQVSSCKETRLRANLFCIDNDHLPSGD